MNDHEYCEMLSKLGIVVKTKFFKAVSGNGCVQGFDFLDA